MEYRGYAEGVGTYVTVDKSKCRKTEPFMDYTEGLPAETYVNTVLTKVPFYA